MAEKIPGWLEKVLLPQIGELKGEIKLVHARIDGVEQRLGMKIEESNLRVEQKIDEVDKRLGMKIEESNLRVEQKIDEVDKRLGMKIEESNLRLGQQIDELDKRLAMTQRLAVVEEQLKELRAKA